jgi:hypothetical protein
VALLPSRRSECCSWAALGRLVAVVPNPGNHLRSYKLVITLPVVLTSVKPQHVGLGCAHCGVPVVKFGQSVTYGKPAPEDGPHVAWTPAYRDPKVVPVGPLLRLEHQGELVSFPTSSRVQLRCDRCKTENVYSSGALIVLAAEAGLAGKKYVRLPSSVPLPESCPSLCP